MGGTSTRPVQPERKEDEETGNAVKVKTSGKRLSAVGLPFGPSRKELEQCIELLSSEKYVSAYLELVAVGLSRTFCN